MLDGNGYPLDGDVEKIAKWAFKKQGDYAAFMEFVKARWNYADIGYWRQRGRTYRVSTGGWSGNEEVIVAMENNWMFWAVCWVQSRKGGHFIFEIPNETKFFKSDEAHRKGEGGGE